MNAGPVSVTPPEANRVVVISLMKSGTHLIQELMIALGYWIYGQSRIPKEVRPVLSDEMRHRIARMVYDEEEVSAFQKQGEESFGKAAQEAWEALGWAWQVRFGMPLASHYGVQLVNTDLVERTLRRTASSSFLDTPENVCWIFPELDITRVDGRFIQEWSDTGRPKVIFMYRDPRDTTLSMVNFLLGRTGQGFGTFSDFKVFNRILESKGSMQERLKYALTDDVFPGIGDHKRMLWLLNHPDVCTVSFEEMIGAQGGGSVDAQTEAVARVVKFLGLDANPDELAGRLYRRDSFTFFKGQIGTWREAFTPELMRLAEHRFGDALPAYGYEW
jgi:hypothetical protein